MAILGTSRWTLPRYVRGGKPGGCTTRRKKTQRKRWSRRPSVAEILAAWNPTCSDCDTPLVPCWCPGMYCPKCEPECMAGKIGELGHRTSLLVEPKIPPFNCALPILPAGLQKGERHGQ